jgi:hypothetical protein
MRLMLGQAIKLIVKDGGKALIQIVDGVGMSAGFV